MENATLHILTPYPGTPLFRRMEAEGRILHRDWDRYDTGHCVFRPRHMAPEVLEAGYHWCYERLFSAASIWRRRPRDPAAVAPYLGMIYLYRHSDALWEFLIRRQWVHAAWRPLVEWTRRRHLAFRARLHARGEDAADLRPRKAGTLASAP
jgi:radical SAM superfamily enzyme YgiQ (UPF0313 family)